MSCSRGSTDLIFSIKKHIVFEAGGFEEPRWGCLFKTMNEEIMKHYGNPIAVGTLALLVAWGCGEGDNGAKNPESTDEENGATDSSTGTDGGHDGETFAPATCNEILQWAEGCGFSDGARAELNQQCSEMGYSTLETFIGHYLGCLMGYDCETYTLWGEEEEKTGAQTGLNDCIAYAASRTALDEKRRSLVEDYCTYQADCEVGRSTQSCVDDFDMVDADMLYLMMTDQYVDDAMACYDPMPTCSDPSPSECIGGMSLGLVDAAEDVFAPLIFP